MAKSGYDVYLKNCLLPVTPEKIQISVKNANKTITLINEGEVNIIKKAKLTDIEFECEIPQVKHPYAVYKSGFKGAKYFLDYFEKLKVSEQPFRFMVCRNLPSGKVLFNNKITVTLEDYKVTEEAKNGFDLVVKISLKQWKNHGTKTVDVTIGESKTVASVTQKRATINSPTSKLPTRYTAVKGDCLCNIAKKFYDDGSKYVVIHEVNKDIIGSNPNLIYPGQVLTIPNSAKG